MRTSQKRIKELLNELSAAAGILPSEAKLLVNQAKEDGLI